MEKERIVVTGMGIISALGTGVEKTYVALQEGRSGVGPLEYLQTEHRDIPCAEVKLSDEALVARLGIKKEEVATRTALLGIEALREAWASAGLSLQGQERVAFINGTTVGGMEKSERYYLDFLENDSRNAYIAAHECGACTERIADDLGGFSYVTTLSTACSSAANAVMLGANLIKAGRTDIAVVGGSECLTKFHLNGFHSLMILDPQPCRPFDATRAGLNLGEGAAYLVLEREADALARGASPLCVVAGYGNACDAFHQTASSENGTGATMAMQEALEMSGLRPEEIDYINAHGTGTRNNDLSEGRAIVNVFGAHIPYVSSTKAMTGHTTSASGAVEAVISILAIQRKFVPVNLRFAQPMPELPFSPVYRPMEGVPLRHVLSNSFGFGGNNSSLIFSAWTERNK